MRLASRFLGNPEPRQELSHFLLKMKRTTLQTGLSKKGATAYAILLTLVVLEIWLFVYLGYPGRKVVNLLSEIKEATMQIDFRQSSEQEP